MIIVVELNFDTDADNAQNALQQEWGNFSLQTEMGFVEDFRYSLHNW